MDAVLREIANIKFRNMPFGDRHSISLFISLVYPTLSDVRFSKQIVICTKCGNYSYSTTSCEKNIFCKCEDTYRRKCKYVHAKKYNILLDEMVRVGFKTANKSFDFVGNDLLSENILQSISNRYWCRCGYDVGGMMGSCYNVNCRDGRKKLRLRLNK